MRDAKSLNIPSIQPCWSALETSRGCWQEGECLGKFSACPVLSLSNTAPEVVGAQCCRGDELNDKDERAMVHVRDRGEER